jgi:hypothetical protein
MKPGPSSKRTAASRFEAIRRLIEIALTNKAKRQSNRGEK